MIKIYDGYFSDVSSIPDLRSTESQCEGAGKAEPGITQPSLESCQYLRPKLAHNVRANPHHTTPQHGRDVVLIISNLNI